MRSEEKFNFKIFIIEAIGTILGAGIMAFAVSFFLLPNQLSSGGFSGIATITYYFLHLPMGTVILALNTPFFIFSIFVLGKDFFVKSLLGTVSLSFFIDLFDRFEPLTQDRFLACIYGGILAGLGSAIILKVRSSTGGSDLISAIAKRFNPNVRMSNVIIIIDIIIVTLNMIFFREIEVGLYSAIAIYLMGKIIDIIFEGIYFTKLIIIVSDKNEEIAQKIGDIVKRGTTRIIWKRNVYKQRKTSSNVCSI